MSEVFSTCTWFVAIVAACFIFGYWIGLKLIDKALPDYEAKAKRDMEDLLAAANSDVEHRKRLAPPGGNHV